jgi:hypothetical protein
MLPNHDNIKSLQEFDDLGGKTVGLLLCLSKSIWGSARIIILDSGFCALKGIIELGRIDCMH